MDLPKTSRPAQQALESIGIRKLEDLINFTEEEILSLHGMGAKALLILKEIMHEHGLQFLPERVWINKTNDKARGVS